MIIIYEQQNGFQKLEKEESLQQNYVCISTGKKVGTKYGYIILRFWEDTQIQNLQKVV